LNRGQRRKYLVDQMIRQDLALNDEPRDAVIRNVAERTEGYVGADLEGLCREAGIFAMRENAKYVTLRHFEQSLEKVHPTMNERLKEFYDRIRQHFKGGLPKEVQPPEYQ
jgi:transitional endoplasmic reticulum ATPase